MSNATDETDQAPVQVERPSKMAMTLQRGMLKTLGINLYANIGKVLVEFVANAYDSDAKSVNITLPFEKIAHARLAIKKAVAEQEAGTEPQTPLPLGLPVFDAMMVTLPDDIAVVIEDNGHGMGWEDIEKKFLPINRQRRKDSDGRETKLTTVEGRYVMGRKGVGKLAGFGAAEKVVLESKRKGDTYATVITMTDLDHEEAAAQISIPATYSEGLDADLQYTKITLSKLKADAFKSGPSTISDTIASAFFAIKPEDFEIKINDVRLEAPVPDYEFVFPEHLTLEQVKEGEMVDDYFDVPEVGRISFRYYVGFRKRSEHLPAAKRGARIYCNSRLAAGPTLFNLGTGMHSFHSTDYMECIVEADALDRGSVDLISTSRTQFQEGNEIFDALQDKIGGIMRSAIYRHGVFRDKLAVQEIQKDATALVIQRSVDQLPRPTRLAATKLLTTMASHYGVGTAEFEELAPIIMNSVNATDVLARLVTSGTKPETVSEILSQLRELSEIEQRDILKLYRGRRGGITKLQNLQKQGHDLWKKKGLEKTLHELFKENPWLIRPEFTNYIASDVALNTVASKLAQYVKVDKFAEIKDGEETDTTRPDLVFLLSDRGGEGPYVIRIVELKSPTLPLTINHYRQLEDYILKVDRWCRTELNRTLDVTGYLIGEMPEAQTANPNELGLLDKLRASGPDAKIKVVGLTQLINDAYNIHIDAINALERELEGEDEPEGVQAATATPANENASFGDKAS